MIEELWRQQMVGQSGQNAFQRYVDYFGTDDLDVIQQKMDNILSRLTPTQFVRYRNYALDGRFDQIPEPYRGFFGAMVGRSLSATTSQPSMTPSTGGGGDPLLAIAKPATGAPTPAPYEEEQEQQRGVMSRFGRWLYRTWKKAMFFNPVNWLVYDVPELLGHWSAVGFMQGTRDWWEEQKERWDRINKNSEVFGAGELISDAFSGMERTMGSALTPFASAVALVQGDVGGAVRVWKKLGELMSPYADTQMAGYMWASFMDEIYGRTTALDYVVVKVEDNSGRTQILNVPLQEAENLDKKRRRGEIRSVELLDTTPAVVKWNIFGLDVNPLYTTGELMALAADPTMWSSSAVVAPSRLGKAATRMVRGLGVLERIRGAADLAVGISSLPITVPFGVVGKTLGFVGRQAMRFPEVAGVANTTRGVLSKAFQLAPFQAVVKTVDWVGRHFSAGYYFPEDVVGVGIRAEKELRWIGSGERLAKTIGSGADRLDRWETFQKELTDMIQNHRKLMTAPDEVSEAVIERLGRDFYGLAERDINALKMMKQGDTEGLQVWRRLMDEYGIAPPPTAQRFLTTPTAPYGIAKTLAKWRLMTMGKVNALTNRFPSLGIFTTPFSPKMREAERLAKVMFHSASAFKETLTSQFPQVLLALTGDVRFEATPLYKLSVEMDSIDWGRSVDFFGLPVYDYRDSFLGGYLKMMGWSPERLSILRRTYEEMKTFTQSLTPEGRRVFRQEMNNLLLDMANGVVLDPERYRDILGRIEAVAGEQGRRLLNDIMTVAYSKMGEYRTTVASKVIHEEGLQQLKDNIEQIRRWRQRQPQPPVGECL